MNSRSVLTISVVSGLFGLYMLYALTMNSLIGVQTLGYQPTHSVPAPEAPAVSRELVKSYLITPDTSPWELESRYYVRKSRSHLYYNDWVHRPYHPDDPDNAIEFTPFAMIMEGDSDRPVTMQAESARIRFSKAFSPQNPETGRPIEGALIGKVRITGPDGLVINGRNFGYSEDSRSIYSDEMVEFQYGGHRGRADGIRLDVMIDRTRMTNEEFAVSGIKLITFRGKVNLDVSPGEMQGETPSVDKLVVNCDGGLVFDPRLNVATFRDRVSVVAPHGFSGAETLQPDALNCDILKLIFVPEEPAVAQEAADESDDEEFQGIQKGLVLTEIDAAAVGRRVTFVSEGHGVDAEMDSFHYNQITRVATLRDPADNVIVTQNDTKIYSPMMVMQHDEAGDLSSVVCDGPGELFYYDDETRELELRTSWLKQLRVTPSGNENVYLIELDERAIVTRPVDQFGLAADHIKLWVTQNESDKAEPRSASTGDDGWRGDGMTPQNLLALGNVRMSHPTLKGTTNRLEIWFEQLNQTAPVPRQGAWLQQRQNVVTSNKPSSPPPEQLLQRTSFQRSASARRLPAADQRSVQQPFYAWADLIQVLFYLGDEQQESYVGGVVTTGKVKVQQPQTDGSAPLEMIGDRLEMRNRDAGNENQIVHVFGSPAKISDQNMSLAGNLLNLDRSSNKAWVTGPGVMMHLVQTDFQGNPLEQPELLKVWWTEKMEFNGREARFFDSVRTQLGKSSIECQEMVVRLDQKIDFKNAASPQESASEEQPKITHLECLYGVKVDNEEYEDGELIEVRQGEFSKLVYDQTTQKTRITGPGIFAVWRVPGNSSYGFGELPSQTSEENKPDKKEGWEYLEIDFDGDMDGYLDQQITSFNHGANLVFGPVDRPGIKISRHELPDGGGWMRSEVLDVAATADPQTDESWMEFRASGNVKLEGQDGEKFHARADMITYSQKQDKYRLRSLRDRYSTIWRQKRPGDAFKRAVARVMEFQPKQHELKLDETTTLEGIE
ncbi:MAG: hypothetical protein HUJ26_12830 [Planctomycetaceae bacterium]|nr:hypothetical protein [Planctomycetaceae bacterium]